MATPWSEMKDRARRKWGQLPDGRFEELEHRRALFVSLFQIFQGLSRQDANREVDQWSGTADRPAPAARGWSWWPWRRRA